MVPLSAPKGEALRLIEEFASIGVRSAEGTSNHAAEDALAKGGNPNPARLISWAPTSPEPSQHKAAVYSSPLTDQGSPNDKRRPLEELQPGDDDRLQYADPGAVPFMMPSDTRSARTRDRTPWLRLPSPTRITDRSFAPHPEPEGEAPLSTATSTQRATINAVYATNAQELWQSVVDYHEEVRSSREQRRREAAERRNSARERRDVARRLKERQQGRAANGADDAMQAPLPAPWTAGSPPKKVMQSTSEDLSSRAELEARRPLTEMERKAELARLTMQRRQKIILGSARGLKGGPPSQLNREDRKAAQGRLYALTSVRPRSGRVYS